jgi:HlyD family secretion protein
VLHWGGDAPLVAKVRRIEPSAFTKTSALGVDEQRVNVILDPDGANDGWSAIGDGFAAEVEIAVWSKPDAVQVPTSALFRHDDGLALFVVTGGHAAMRGVQTGHRGALQTEITSGLQTGEIVVIHPGASVQDGARVEWR